MRVRQRLALLVAAALSAVNGSAVCRAEDEIETAPGTVVKTTDQLRFVVPADWLVERRGGLTGPIPVEEYLAMKFSGLEGRLRAMDQQLQGLEVRLRVLEESAKTQQQGLRSGEEPR